MEMTRSILLSMKHGSKAGQGLFPLAILAAKENAKAALAFSVGSSTVGARMFLPWVNQLVCHLRSSQCIKRLLVDICC